MEIKLIAADLDGTLLNSKKELTPRTKRALDMAAEKGIYIVPATGRIFAGMPQVVRDLPYVRYGICINGGSVWDSQAGEALCKSEIPYNRAEEIFDHIEQYHTMYDCYVGGWGWTDRKFYDNLGEYIEEEEIHNLVRATRKPIENFRRHIKELGQDIQKIIMFVKDPAEHDRIMEELKRDLPDISVTAALTCNIELNLKGANKGSALTYLCNHLGFGPENAIAFGDGGNDKELIQAAGMGVVMSNGTDELKSIADYITIGNDEDGVAVAIEKFVLGMTE